MRHRWSVKGRKRVWRSPWKQDGVWRVRRRDRTTGKVDSITVWIEAKDPYSGRLKRRHPRTLAEAQKAVTLLAMAEGGQDERVMPARVALPLAAEQWLSIITSHVRPTTAGLYRHSMKMLLVCFEQAGVKLASDVRLEHIDMLFRSPRWSSQTRKFRLSLLNRFWRWAIDAGIATTNPVASYRRALTGRETLAPATWRREARRARRRGVVLTDEQCRALLLGCKGGATEEHSFTLYAAVLLALRTGLRAGNLVRLSWSQLRDNLSVLSISAEQMKSDEPFVVPLHSEAVAMLQQIKNRRPGALTTDRVLGLGSCVGGFRRRLRRAASRAGLDMLEDANHEPHTIRAHDLRHTFAAMAKRHCSYQAVVQLLGHSPRGMTGQYGFFNTEDLRAEIEQIPWLIPQSQEPAGKTDPEERHEA